MTRLSNLFFSTAIAVMAVSVAMPAAAQGSVIEIQGEVVASCTAVAPTIPVNLGQINTTVDAGGNTTGGALVEFGCSGTSQVNIILQSFEGGLVSADTEDVIPYIASINASGKTLELDTRLTGTGFVSENFDSADFDNGIDQEVFVSIDLPTEDPTVNAGIYRDDLNVEFSPS